MYLMRRKFEFMTFDDWRSVSFVFPSPVGDNAGSHVDADILCLTSSSLDGHAVKLHSSSTWFLFFIRSCISVCINRPSKTIFHLLHCDWEGFENFRRFMVHLINHTYDRLTPKHPNDCLADPVESSTGVRFLSMSAVIFR